jgi:hypothetical protein
MRYHVETPPAASVRALATGIREKLTDFASHGLTAGATMRHVVILTAGKAPPATSAPAK